MRIRILWIERALLALAEWRRKRVLLRTGSRLDIWREFYR